MVLVRYFWAPSSLRWSSLIDILDELHREPAESNIDEPSISQPLCTAFQIALVDLLKTWAIQPCMVVGHSSGEIAAAYAAGILSLQSAMSVAYHRGRLSSELSLEHRTPRGAMLAVGLSAVDVQPYIEGVCSGKIMVACINSPESITLSGDFEAIHELHSLFGQKGLFSRKLRVNVAYHSDHMKAIAEEYSKSLRGLDVQPGRRGVKFYSSVFPGVPVEIEPEYWVKNLLSPVRFSEAMSILLDSQSEYDVTCIEIGPHSALAGPFKQICRSVSAEGRMEYFSSILRNKNDVDQALKLACDLFYNGWKLDLASINFPDGKTGARVLTDLPPYAWNHDTQYWHGGRLSRNYLHRTHPPHDLLGTLSDDSSDIDMRWSKYIRQSELLWLKDHVIRSEVLFPAGAYLAMAIEAVSQKASISSSQIHGYTLRDVTFSKALLIPDTPNGLETSLILEPFRQSSAAASSIWDEFRVISFGSDRKAYEHCHGLISVAHKPQFDFTSSDKATLAMMRYDEAMKFELYQQWFAQAAANGNDLGPSFQLVSKCCLKDEHAFFALRIPNQEEYESPLTISVPLIDAFLQVTILSLVGMARGLDGTLVPTSIAEMTISNSISRDSGEILHSRGSTAELGPRNFEGRVIVAQDRDDILEPVVQIDGAKFVCLPRDEEHQKSDDAKAKLCWGVSWEDDADEIFQEDIVKRWPVSEIASHEYIQTEMCEKAVWYCLLSVFECLTEVDVERMAPHHRSYYNWMKARYDLGKKGGLPFQKNGLQEEWSRAEPDAVERTLQEVAAGGAQGCMTIRLGRRLLEILRGEVEPLSLMLEDDSLNRYYAESRGQDRVYEQVARFMRLAAHKNPKLEILEIGAGTGYVNARRVCLHVC